MTCEKCGYHDKKESEKFSIKLCSICIHFAPDEKEQFEKYIKEKIDWKLLDTFRKYNQTPGNKLKISMEKKAKSGNPMTRPPLGYSLTNRSFQPNQDATKVHSMFRIFLEKNYSLNSLAKNYGLSVNGLKKVLTNRTYLGEIKFAGALHKSNHQALIAPEIFYAVQRKLKEISRTNTEK